MAHVCVTVRASGPRQVSWATSFEMDFSRIVLNGVGIAPQPMCWSLDYAPAIQNVCHKWFSMDMGESNALANLNGCPADMIDTWVNSPRMCPSKLR